MYFFLAFVKVIHTPCVQYGWAKDFYRTWSIKRNGPPTFDEYTNESDINMGEKEDILVLFCAEFAECAVC